MSRALQVGAIYGAAGFALGFLLGTLRVLVLTPRIGEGWALAIELPLMVVFGWFFAGWCVRRLAIPRSDRSAWIAGGLAFLLLQGLEMLTAAMLGRNPLEYLSGLFASDVSQGGFVAQMLYATFLVHRIAIRKQ